MNALARNRLIVVYSIPVVLAAFGFIVGLAAGGWFAAGIAALLALAIGLVAGPLNPATWPGSLGVASAGQVDKNVWCVPSAQFADCTFERDEAGRYVDVLSCGLKGQEEKVTCEKRCLALMNQGAAPDQVVPEA